MRPLIHRRYLRRHLADRCEEIPAVLGEWLFIAGYTEERAARAAGKRMALRVSDLIATVDTAGPYDHRLWVYRLTDDELWSGRRTPPPLPSELPAEVSV